MPSLELIPAALQGLLAHLPSPDPQGGTRIQEAGALGQVTVAEATLESCVRRGGWQHCCPHPRLLRVRALPNFLSPSFLSHSFQNLLFFMNLVYRATSFSSVDEERIL
jgi:hypothetical protein